MLSLVVLCDGLSIAVWAAVLLLLAGEPPGEILTVCRGQINCLSAPVPVRDPAPVSVAVNLLGHPGVLSSVSSGASDSYVWRPPGQFHALLVVSAASARPVLAYTHFALVAVVATGVPGGRGAGALWTGLACSLFARGLDGLDAQLGAIAFADVEGAVSVGGDRNCIVDRSS